MTAAASKLFFATKILAIKCKGNIREQPKSLSFAVLGDQHRQKCRILIYISKNQHISVASIHSDFEFFICEDNDISYLDDAEDQWIVKFSDFNNFVDSFRQIFLCVFYARTPVDSWHMGKCYRRTQTAFRSPEIGDSVRVSYSLLRCDAVGMRTCLSKDETIEISQPTENQFDHFLTKYLLSMLCADKKLVIFDSRRLPPLPGISKPTDIMALDLHLIDVSDPSNNADCTPSANKETLRDRMASLGKSIFGPTSKGQPIMSATKGEQSAPITDILADFEVFVDQKSEEKVPQEPTKDKRESPPQDIQSIAVNVRKSHSETKLALVEIETKIDLLIRQMGSEKVPKKQIETRSVQLQFCSDNKQPLIAAYRNSVISQRKTVEVFSKHLSTFMDALSTKIKFLETRLHLISNLHQSASSKLITKNKNLQTMNAELENKPKTNSEDFSLEEIKKILNYIYRSVKTEVVTATSTKGFDSNSSEYFLQTLHKNIKNTLGKLQIQDK